ncbi:MAG: hypothetical protein HKO66_15045 [Saprospiraceae bacterium]|nr:hypothetical protein [Bacteroidia bacterium]NNE15431.1 hypothetical protein [Saprospiraceae bacterium]NNL93556.1 hypothetical protein [Saprospiraceae bacterium]
MKLLLQLSAVLLFSSINAQSLTDNPMDAMFFYGDAMHNLIEGKNRDFAGDQFYRAFNSYISDENGFALNPEDLKTISILTSEDASFKIFSWLVKGENASRYFGFIIYPDGSFKELNSQNNLDSALAYASNTAEDWYGALYYNMMKLEENKYLVFGYNEVSRFKKQKLVDVITINGDEIIFGEEIFEDKEDLGTYLNRIVLDYSADAGVNLNYNPSLEMIVHDHLTQRMGQLEGQGPTNVPDGTYEGYKLADGKWMYEEKLFNHSYGENNAPRPKPVLNKNSVFKKKKK